MRPAAKGQKIVLECHVLLALWAEAVWVEYLSLCVALNGETEIDDSQIPRGLFVTIYCVLMALWEFSSDGIGEEPTHLHGGRN